jgi:hypothetical protein
MRIKKSIVTAVAFSGTLVFWLQPGWSQVSSGDEGGTQRRSLEQNRKNRPGTGSDIGGPGDTVSPSGKQTEPNSTLGTSPSGSRRSDGNTSDQTGTGSFGTQSGTKSGNTDRSGTQPPASSTGPGTGSGGTTGGGTTGGSSGGMSGGGTGSGGGK